MKWLVLWVAIISMSVRSEPPTDKYTGEVPRWYAEPTVYSSKTYEKPMMKYFETEEEAQAFIDKAPEYKARYMVLIDTEEDTCNID